MHLALLPSSPFFVCENDRASSCSRQSSRCFALKSPQNRFFECACIVSRPGKICHAPALPLMCLRSGAYAPCMVLIVVCMFLGSGSCTLLLRPEAITAWCNPKRRPSTRYCCVCAACESHLRQHALHAKNVFGLLLFVALLAARTLARARVRPPLLTRVPPRCAAAATAAATAATGTAGTAAGPAISPAAACDATSHAERGACGSRGRRRCRGLASCCREPGRGTHWARGRGGGGVGAA